MHAKSQQHGLLFENKIAEKKNFKQMNKFASYRAKHRCIELYLFLFLSDGYCINQFRIGIYTYLLNKATEHI